MSTVKERDCPDCGSTMKVKMARRGANLGHLFHGCSDWSCKCARSIYEDGQVYPMLDRVEVLLSTHHKTNFADFIAYGEAEEGDVAMFTKQIPLDALTADKVIHQFVDVCFRMFDNTSGPAMDRYMLDALNYHNEDQDCDTTRVEGWLDDALAEWIEAATVDGEQQLHYYGMACVQIPDTDKWALIARTTGNRGIVLKAFEPGDLISDIADKLDSFIDKTLDKLYVSEEIVLQDIPKALREAHNGKIGALAARMSSALEQLTAYWEANGKVRLNRPCVTPPKKPTTQWNRSDVDRFHRYLEDEQEKLRKHLYTPAHCPKCGRDDGCMHPPPEGAQRGSEPACGHLRVSRIPFTVAKELNPHMPDNETTRATKFWACDSCQKIMLSQWTEGEKAPHYMGVDWATGPDATAAVVTDGKKITHHLELKTTSTADAKHFQKKIYERMMKTNTIPPHFDHTKMRKRRSDV